MKKNPFKHFIPLRIGFCTKDKIRPEKLPMFTSVYTIYRGKANDIITFQKEQYKKVNTEWDCYIKLSEYNMLFPY